MSGRVCGGMVEDGVVEKRHRGSEKESGEIFVDLKQLEIMHA